MWTMRLVGQKDYYVPSWEEGTGALRKAVSKSQNSPPEAAGGGGEKQFNELFCILRAPPAGGVTFSFVTRWGSTGWGSLGPLSSPQVQPLNAVSHLLLSSSRGPIVIQPEGWLLGSQDSGNPASCCEGAGLVSPGPCGP